jgi:hypothetical protein
MAARHPGETLSRILVHLQAFIAPEQRERRLHALRVAGLPE